MKWPPSTPCTTQRAKEKYVQALDGAQTAEERLQKFIATIFQRILDSGRPAWHGKLMAREMIDPTPALDSIVKESVVPLLKMLHDTIREILALPLRELRIDRTQNGRIGRHLERRRDGVDRRGLSYRGAKKNQEPREKGGEPRKHMC